MKVGKIAPKRCVNWPIRFILCVFKQPGFSGAALRKARILVLATALSLSLIQQSFGIIPPAQRAVIEQELTAPITLDLKNRQSISGHPVNVRKTELDLASAKGAGEIIFTFSYDQIETIKVPGESYKSLAMEWLEAGMDEEALDLMHLLFQQRRALLHILPPSESNFFVLYVELILDSDDPTRTLAVSARLRPQIVNPDAIEALDSAILESYQRLEFYEDALPMAKVAVAKKRPYGKSALGYYVLGCDHLRRAEYEAALDLALQPIVFASLIPTDKLAHCYALAVSAAYELREKAQAALLYAEMIERGFSWPENDSTLKPYLKIIKDHIADHEAD